MQRCRTGVLASDCCGGYQRTTGIPGMRRAWSAGWAGLCNTDFWVDRATGICASIYSSFLPFVTPEAIKLHNDFEKALYAFL